MAEVLAISASVASFFSLTVQLVEVTRSIRNYWSLFQGVSVDARNLTTILLEVEQLLLEISAFGDGEEDRAGMLLSCVKHCKTQLDVMLEVVEKMKTLEAKGKKRQPLTSLKILFLKDKASTVRKALTESVESLSLALLVLQSRTGRSQTKLLFEMERSVDILAREQARIAESSTDLNTQVTSLWKDIARSVHSSGSASTAPIVKEVRLTMGDISTSSSSSNSQGLLTDGEANARGHTDDLKSPDGLPSIYAEQPHKKRGGVEGVQNGYTFQRGKSGELQVFTHKRYYACFGYLRVTRLVRKGPRGRTSKHLAESSHSSHHMDIQINFHPSIIFGTGFAARLWKNVSGGRYELTQTLRTTPILPNEKIIPECFEERGGTTNLLRLLQEQKITPNATDQSGFSLLAWAIEYTHLEGIGLLIEFGAVCHELDNFGFAPLHQLMKPRDGIISEKQWAIYRLLVDRGQADPWACDIVGRNFWHAFCMARHGLGSVNWKSVGEIFLPIIDEQDYTGLTALFTLSANVHSDPDILHWHLQNGANLSITADGCRRETQGLTCLHGVLSGLRPRCFQAKLRWSDTSSQRQPTEGLTVVYPFAKDDYSDNHRARQRKKIELLIQYGADLHAVSMHYGTPTDVARLTGNFQFWLRILKGCGINTKEFLAKDKSVARDEAFLRSLTFAKKLKRERKRVQRSWVTIYTILEEFQKIHSQRSTTQRIMTFPSPPILEGTRSVAEVLSLVEDFVQTTFPDCKETAQHLDLATNSLRDMCDEFHKIDSQRFTTQDTPTLPRPSILVGTGTAAEVLSLLEGFMQTAFPVYLESIEYPEYAQTNILKDIYDEGMYYFSWFFGNTRQYHRHYSLPCPSKVQWIRDFLKIFAVIASGDGALEGYSWDWESYGKALRVLEAAATLYLEVEYRFPDLQYDWEKYDGMDKARNMPGAWPEGER